MKSKIFTKRRLQKTAMGLVLTGVVACMDSSTQSGNPDGGGKQKKGSTDGTRGNGETNNTLPGDDVGLTQGGDAGVTASLNKDVLAELPVGESQLKIMCGRSGNDKVRQIFCTGNPPKITGLKDLQARLGLSANGSGGLLGGLVGSSGFVLSGHSSSLVGKFTSAANPRVIMFNNQGGNVALGFVRGEQFAEVAVQDPSSRQLKFFLIKFTQDCNDSEGGCTNGDLLGPAIESNWKSVTVYEDVDIENTILDCKQCHQPGGEGTTKIFRMQELRNPWTHFMRSNSAGGRALLADFEKVHAGEEFGGIPANRISQTDPAKLERFVRGAGHGNQPNEFPSAVVAVTGRNGTWQSLYENFVTGKAIAPPYHGLRVADPAKFETVAKAYKQFRAGNLDGAELPDMRDVLLESGLRDMGFMVKAGLPADKMLIQACSQCHNSKLNQNISRAKFDVDLSKMSQEEKELAIERMKLANDDPKKMPPVRFRVLTESEISSLEELLKK